LPYLLSKLNPTLPPSKFFLSKVTPNPKNKLKKGPANQPVRAILAYPFLATAMFAMVSPHELPPGEHCKTKEGWFDLEDYAKHIDYVN
jgi:hypothetical protein